MFLTIFSFWGNIQPVSKARTGVGFEPKHLILALGYTALYVFFINPKKNHGITRMNQDGTDIVQVSPNDCHWMNLYQNKLYYIQDSDVD